MEQARAGGVKKTEAQKEADVTNHRREEVKAHSKEQEAQLRPEEPLPAP